jgi:hypothetical protein
VDPDRHPQHALYQALAKHDFVAFATSQLDERRRAGLPPFSSLALVRAEARDAAVATAFLQAASAAAADLPEGAAVSVYPPVPPAITRVAGIERMQMLVESASRPALQRFLAGLAAGCTRCGPGTRAWCAGRSTWTRWRSERAVASPQAGRTPNSHAMPVKLAKAITVELMMMRATRPLSAP